MKLRQKAVHNNGTTGSVVRTTDSYSQRSHSNSYSESNYSQRTSWPYRASGGYDSGGYAYSQGGSHSNTAAQNSYSERYGYSERANVSGNLSPKISNGASLASGTYGTPTITFNLSSLTYSDTENNTAKKYRIYTAYSSNGTSFGAGSLLAEITTTTYNWAVTNVTAGFYKVAVTVYDGYTGSALPNSSGTGWVAHQVEGGTVNSTGNTATYDSSKDTITYAESGVFKIIHYTPPTWITDYYTKPQVDQIVTEINAARTAFGLSSYTFTTTNYVKDFTLIAAQQMNEFHAAANDVYKAAKGSNYTYTNTEVTTGQEIIRADMRDIQDLLSRLS